MKLQSLLIGKHERTTFPGNIVQSSSYNNVHLHSFFFSGVEKHVDVAYQATNIFTHSHSV